MANIFSVPIFFIVFRETLEAVIIISVLLGIVEKIVHTRVGRDSLPATELEKDKHHPESGSHEVPSSLPSNDDDDAASRDDGEQKKLLRKLRIQVSQVLLLNPPIEPHLPRFAL
jgi:high-affinity iron transporter